MTQPTYLTNFTSDLEILKKIEAFITLYGENPDFYLFGTLEDVNRDLIFCSVDGVKVKSWGSRYISVEVDGTTAKIDLRNPHHGIIEVKMVAFYHR